jgi:hypothetical protein
MSFQIEGIKYVVLNDGCVEILQSKDATKLSGRAVPISFEVVLQIFGADSRQRSTISSTTLPAMKKSLDKSLHNYSPQSSTPASPIQNKRYLTHPTLTQAFVLHIQKTKAYIYHGRFSAEYLQQILSGEKVTASASVERYPQEGFDLDDPSHREDFYKSIFRVVKYCISGRAKIGNLDNAAKPKQVNV